MGAIPPKGASIVVEYIVTDGNNANIYKSFINGDDNWQWDGDARLANGNTVPLNKNFKIRLTTDIIFGTESEDTALTQLIAPHASRSFVLASETNYKYFFQRMNMFSDIEIIRGSYTVNGASVMKLAADQALENYNVARQTYRNAVDTWGIDSEQAAELHKDVEKTYQIYEYAHSKLNDNTYRDNTVYIFLVPDINKRISANSNYFTCDESLFYLSDDE